MTLLIETGYKIARCNFTCRHRYGIIMANNNHRRWYASKATTTTTTPITTSPSGTTTAAVAAAAGTIKKRVKAKDTGSLHLGRAGLPMILFCGLGVWVVANGIEGKNKERDAFQGRMSKSDRQARLEQEHDEMVEKLNQIVNQDFDNTKRIERPEEILARRRREREARNVWYRRYWRWIRGQE